MRAARAALGSVGGVEVVSTAVADGEAVFDMFDVGTSELVGSAMVGVRGL